VEIGAKKFEYGRIIQVAHQEWRDNNVGVTLALLDSTRPDLRGWEWHYVQRLCNTSLLTCKGHTSVVQSAAFSPDGTRIVTASWDMTAKVWDAKTGAEVFALTGHTKDVKSAAFSPDGTRIVTASLDGTAKVWDAKTGAEVLSLTGHTGEVRSAAFSLDGSLIVTGSGNKAMVWDAKTGAKVVTLSGHTGGVASASFSPDGTRIVTSGGPDRTAIVWDSRPFRDTRPPDR
jgi:WD40 repeat protein